MVKVEGPLARVIPMCIRALALGILCLTAAPAFGQSLPREVNYQGRLTDISGSPITGTVSMDFRLFDADVSGTELWAETQPTVAVEAGVFTVLLGSVTPFDSGVVTFSTQYWLEVEVDGDLMADRLALVPVPYAHYADTAGDARTLGGQSAGALAPTFLYWAGHKMSDSTPISLAMTRGARLLLAPGTTSWLVYDSVMTGAPYPRNPTNTVSGLSIDPAVSARVFDGVAEHIVAFAWGGTTPYRYNDDGTAEVALTFSGTPISTGAYRIGFDPSSRWIYVGDSADYGATTYRVYSLSGTTLTHEADLILTGATPAATGFPTLHIGANYLTIDETSGNNDVVLSRYDKQTGAHVDTNNWGGWAISTQRVGAVVHPSNHFYICSETVNDNTPNFHFIKWTVDEPW